jgi:hypothetical protein
MYINQIAVWGALILLWLYCLMNHLRIKNLEEAVNDLFKLQMKNYLPPSPTPLTDEEIKDIEND